MGKGAKLALSIVRHVVLGVVAFILIAVMIAGNIVLNANSLVLHKLFQNLTTSYNSTDGSEAYAMGDAMVAQLVEDSAVLLRNENNALPLDPNNAMEKQVNLFGWNATTDGFLLTGTGSGGSPVLDVNRVTLAEAFEEAGYAVNQQLLNDYATESNAKGDKINKYGQFASQSMAAIHNPGESFYTSNHMNEARAFSDVAIIVLSRNTGENCGAGETLNPNGYANGAWLELTANEQLMLKNVSETFADGKVIVLLNTTNTMELGFLEDYNVDAAFYIGPVGQSGARAIPHLMYGEKVVTDKDGNDQVVKLSPSGHTADTYAYNYNLVDGRSYSASWTSTISSNSSIYYQEGIYIGYKWYETADAEHFFDGVETEYGYNYNGIVQYPFGFGLSYTTFKWTVEEWPSNNKLTVDGKYEVKVRVENTGEYPGKDVVQLYYTPCYYDGGIEKAAMNLLAFGKTVTLQPGETQLLTLKFTAYDLASYDDYDKNDNGFCGYELDAGDHVLKLMTDAHTPAECNDTTGKAVSNTFTMTCDGVQFEKDPVTETKVENLFTGDNAYSGTPIDGSTAFTGNKTIEYLSRAGSFANYPTATTYTCVAPSTRPNQNYQTDAWNDADVSGFEYGVDSQMYLTTKEDGSKATAAELGSSDSKLVPNADVMEMLWDYDSEMWDIFLNQLTMNEIVSLITKGQFQTVAIESVGKPFAKEFDGPAGFNQNSVAGSQSDPKWVVFPAEILLGCSWNQQSTYNMGKAMGVIANETGIHGWYGPGLNLHRSAYYGRNFEYYSEDAVLTGKLAAECIRGAKQNNLACYMKHFVCADTGPNSPNWYTWLTEQNLRENYLRAFEIAVKEGGANAVMSGFSAVGATWAGSNYAISTQVLRNEWGFRGSMITDWYNGYMDPVRGILGGNDLWLGSANLTLNNNSSNAVKYAARQSAKNILYTYVDCYMTAKDYQENGDPDDPYKVNIDTIAAGDSSYSPVFVGLWVGVDVVLGVGILASITFAALPSSVFKKKKAK